MSLDRTYTGPIADFRNHSKNLEISASEAFCGNIPGKIGISNGSS